MLFKLLPLLYPILILTILDECCVSALQAFAIALCNFDTHIIYYGRVTIMSHTQFIWKDSELQTDSSRLSTSKIKYNCMSKWSDEPPV